MIWEIIIIFLAGIVIDLLVARYTRAVAEKKIWGATTLSGLITVANFVLLTIIIKGSELNGVCNILAYAGGNTLGTYIALKKV
jgi:hypothetical protein